jgi:hypothetical protein
MSNRLAESFTNLSVVVECLSRSYLWTITDEVRSRFDRIRFAEGYDPQVLVEDPKYEDFSTWAEQLWKHEPLLDLMSEKALKYLEQDRLGNRAVETRRKAERKLNKS